MALARELISAGIQGLVFPSTVGGDDNLAVYRVNCGRKALSLQNQREVIDQLRQIASRHKRPMPEIVKQLVGIIGRKLTAYVGGVRDVRAVDRWLKGGAVYGDAEQRLRIAFQVVRMLAERENPTVIQSSLTGLNPELGDRVPLRLMRESDLETVAPEIMGAMRAFLAGGWSESNGSRIEAAPRPLFRLSRDDAWAIPECAFIKEDGAFSLRRFNDPTSANFDRSQPRGRLRRLCPFLCPPIFKIGHNWGGIDSNCDRGDRG
jgi:hypothetical protein